MAAVSLWTPFAEPRIAARWFSTPNIYYLWPVPVVTALTAYWLWSWLDDGREVPPFLAAVALFLLGYLGLVISNFPYLVPPSLTVWDTAAAPASQIFMLLGTLVLLPIILGYIVFVYWLFRGKVREGESYPLTAARGAFWRPYHRPAEADQRQHALHRARERARHFRHHGGKLRLQRRRRRAGVVGRRPNQNAAVRCRSAAVAQGLRSGAQSK